MFPPMATIVYGAGSLLVTVLFLRRIANGLYRFRYHQFERQAYAKWSTLNRNTKEDFLGTHRLAGSSAFQEAAPLSDQIADELFCRYLEDLRQLMETHGVRDVESLYDYLDHEMMRKRA